MLGNVSNNIIFNPGEFFRRSEEFEIIYLKYEFVWLAVILIEYVPDNSDRLVAKEHYININYNAGPEERI
jgi:hypothetical protein